jgi:hypothetical protein
MVDEMPLKTKKIREAKPRVTQSHHLIYPTEEHPEQECRVRIFKGEHKIATDMQRFLRKTTSRGFCKWLKFWLAVNEDRAIDLEEKK